MNAATALSVIASAIELVIGALALAFAAAPGWKHFRLFAVVAFTAAIYGAGNAVFAVPDHDTALTPWVGRLILATALVHVAAWVAYVRIQYENPIRQTDRVLIGVLIALGAVVLVPGVSMYDGSTTQTVAWAGVTYKIPRATAFGEAVMLMIPFVLLGPVLEYVRQARLGAFGARTHLAGFSIFYVLAINEVLVAVGVLENLYLADVGLLAAVLSVSAGMTYRVTDDARRLQELSAELSLQVRDRTRELTKTRDNLVHTERLAALGRLSASIGHEINNPLSYVMGNLEYTVGELAAGRGNPAIVEALRDAMSGADRIRKIVHELRAFSRGTDADRRELVEVSDVLEAAVKLVWGELRHRARLERELGATPKLFADPTRLTQVFVNLLMNAVQAIPESELGRPESVITMRSRTLPNGHAAIEIIDSGIGIPEHVRARLFEPFFSTKPQDKGNGLGLFVSLGIVTALAGRIEVESQVARGTTVRVVLPPSQEAEVPAQRVPSVPPPSKTCRLLVIDDDVLVARTLARLLSRHQVEVVTSGREALARLQGDDAGFDLVLCDLMMPDVTGMDVYEEVERSVPHLAERFVFISGGGVTDRSREFIERHLERVLPKPIDGRELASLLAKRVGPDMAGVALTTESKPPLAPAEPV